MKNISKAVFVIIGTIVGAGFATGKEVYLFFGSYGIKGLISFIISCAILGIIIYKTLIIANKNNASTYNELLTVLFENKTSRVINCIVISFLSVSFVIMVAGAGAYFEQEFGIPSILGRIVISLICFYILKNNTNGMVKLNTIVIPFLIILVLFFFPLSTIENLNTDNNFSITFILNPLIYASFNSIILIPVLVCLTEFTVSKKEIALIAIICSLIFMIMGIVIFFVTNGIEDIQNIEIPLLYASQNKSKIFAFAYGFGILIAMITSAVSAGLGFIQNISNNKKKQLYILAILCIASIIFGYFGFSSLVKALYPIFGYLGIIELWAILRK